MKMKNRSRQGEWIGNSPGWEAAEDKLDIKRTAIYVFYKLPVTICYISKSMTFEQFPWGTSSISFKKKNPQPNHFVLMCSSCIHCPNARISRSNLEEFMRKIKTTLRTKRSGVLVISHKEHWQKSSTMHNDVWIEHWDLFKRRTAACVLLCMLQ